MTGLTFEFDENDPETWWAVTAVHEAAHGIAAYALTSYEVSLILNRRARRGESCAGECLARFEKSWYGEMAHIFVKNAPFVAHQYEATPCGNKGDLHERVEAYVEFSKMIGAKDEEIFKKHVDTPLMAFFGSPDVQAAVLVLASKLYKANRVVIKRTPHWRNLLDVPDKVYNALEEHVTALAGAISGQPS